MAIVGVDECVAYQLVNANDNSNLLLLDKIWEILTGYHLKLFNAITLKAISKNPRLSNNLSEKSYQFNNSTWQEKYCNGL